MDIVSKEIKTEEKGLIGFNNISLLLLFIIGILTIIVGSLGISIYNDCPNNISSTFVNKLGTSFSLGFGIGIILLIIFNIVFRFSTKLPIILISIILIVISSFNIYTLNKKSNSIIETQFEVAIATLGVGIGILLGMILGIIPIESILIKGQIFGLLLSTILIVFCSININTYQKCDKPSKAKTPLIGIAIILTIAILLFIGIIISFFFG